MRIAITLNIAVGRCDEHQMIPRVAAAGFDGVDLSFNRAMARVDFLDERAADAWLDRLLMTAGDARMRFVQTHAPMFNVFGRTAEDQRCRALYPACIRAAGRLGAGWIVAHPDVFAGPFDRNHRRELLDGNANWFRSLLPVCEKANVGIAIENIFDAAALHGGRNCPRFFGSTPEELADLVDHINHPLVGACWDTGHAHLMQLEQRRAIASLGSRIKALHIHDNSGRDDDHLLPFSVGPAGIEWPAVLAGLRDAGYHGPFCYECFTSFRTQPDSLLDPALRSAAELARSLCLL